MLESVNSTNDYPLGSKVLSSIQKPSIKVKFISASSDFAVNVSQSLVCFFPIRISKVTQNNVSQKLEKDGGFLNENLISVTCFLL